MELNRKEMGYEVVDCIAGDRGYCEHCGVSVLVFTLHLRLLC
jgi:hypothetical protein